MADAGIVRNRAKVDATIANALSIQRLRAERGPGALEELVWSFAASRPGRRPRSMSDVPAITPASTELSRALKQVGLVFVGPTTAYAAMQAIGLVDDHLRGCHAAT
jgi:DNA-3-methyladenine glycosylase I